MTNDVIVFPGGNASGDFTGIYTVLQDVADPSGALASGGLGIPVGTPISLVPLDLSKRIDATLAATYQISATIAPTMTALYAGQALQDVTDYAAKVAIGNFASSRPGEAIASAAVGFQGDVIDAQTPLDEGQYAGYTVTVTGDASPPTQRTYTTVLVRVEYDVVVTEVTGGEVVLQINPLVPDGETVDLNITHAPYTGLYTVTAGSLRQVAPYVLPGTHLVTHDGPASGLTTGSVLTMQDPLAHTIYDSLSVTARAWLRDGSPIAGATGATYTLVADDLGTTITPRATLTDDQGNATQSDGATLAIPAAPASAINPVFIGSAQSSSNLAKRTFPSIDLSAVPDNGRLLVAVSVRKTSTDHQVTEFDLWDGATAHATLVSSHAGVSNTRRTAFFVIDKPAGWSAAQVRYVSSTAGSVDWDSVYVWHVQGATVFEYAHAAATSAPTVTAQITTAVDAALVAVHLEDRATGAASITSGVTGTARDEISAGNYSTQARAETVTVADTPRSVTGTLPGNGNHTITLAHLKAA